VHSAASDLVAAFVDDYHPTAIEETDHGTAVRVYFVTATERDAARADLAARQLGVDAIDVPDEDWARRSQQNLAPIAIGRITVFPNPESRLTNPESRIPNRCTIVIQPSMGFGTGHHATTRLCLSALQMLDLSNAFLLDVGTGSGILAIAAARLGAAGALGIDSDPDAIQSARENLVLNPAVRHVEFAAADLMSAVLPQADVVTANLTGAVLIAAAAVLQRALRPGGSLIVSGLLSEERASVYEAFGTMSLEWEAEEDGWVSLRLSAATKRTVVATKAERRSREGTGIGGGAPTQ
jgi:ribosomal protein L11 methyltransferase